MTDADRIRAIGERLWGSTWQTEMRRALGLSATSDSVKKWASGARHPRPSVWTDLHAVCETRATEVAEAERLARGGLSPAGEAPGNQT